MSKIAAGTGLTSSYASGTLTLKADAVAATATPLMDGTAAVGTATKYAREDHVHPKDTSKQDTLVSGTNIKTINNTSLLGSGNISVVTDVSGKEDTSNKVTSLSSSSTDTQYPSAKCVYDIVGDIETLINAL